MLRKQRQFTNMKILEIALSNRENLAELTIIVLRKF